MQQGSCTAFLAHVQLLARTAELHRSDVGVWVTNWGGEVELEPYMVCLDRVTQDPRLLMMLVSGLLLLCIRVQ